MKTSIVTLSFNQAPFLERAIRSVIEQDYDDIEYIIVDPGSTDGSRDIIERYRDRIAKVIFDPDEGPADGLNKGFAAATGDIFAYINADDAFLPGAIAEVVGEFKRRRDADVLIGHGYIIDQNGRVLRRFRSAPFSPWRYVHHASVVMQQSTFFRRKIYEDVGGFNIQNMTSWDAELVLEMALAGAKISLINKYWSIFTIHPDSITSSESINERYQLDHRRFFRMVTGREPRPLDAIRQRIARTQRWMLDPTGALHRFSDKLFGPPQLPL